MLLQLEDSRANIWNLRLSAQLRPHPRTLEISQSKASLFHFSSGGGGGVFPQLSGGKAERSINQRPGLQPLS